MIYIGETKMMKHRYIKNLKSMKIVNAQYVVKKLHMSSVIMDMELMIAYIPLRLKTVKMDL